MIVTVTPNPGLDRTAEIPRLVRGQVHRADAFLVDPGGKGVNVARALAKAGLETIAVLPAGGAAGRRLMELLEAREVPALAIPLRGHTRTNITIVEADGTTTKINEVGPEVSAEEVEALADRVARAAAGASWLVSCGSLPAGMPESFHGDLVHRTRRPGLRIAVDSSGTPLAAAVAARPDLIKPNHAELAELTGRPLPSLGDVLAAARELRAEGVGAVLVSLGARGALLVEESGEYHAATPPVVVRSTVGAGDATLAGFLAAGGEGPEALRHAVAYGAAACTLPGSAMPSPQQIAPADVTLAGAPDTALALSGVPA